MAAYFRANKRPSDEHLNARDPHLCVCHIHFIPIENIRHGRKHGARAGVNTGARSPLWILKCIELLVPSLCVANIKDPI
jgi:hypothetical protein